MPVGVGVEKRETDHVYVMPKPNSLCKEETVPGKNLEGTIIQRKKWI